jgi:hypothetical protein
MIEIINSGIRLKTDSGELSLNLICARLKQGSTRLELSSNRAQSHLSPTPTRLNPSTAEPR